MSKLARFLGFAIFAVAGGWLGMKQVLQEASAGAFDGRDLAVRSAKLIAVILICSPLITFLLIALHEAAHGAVGALLGRPPTGFGMGTGELLASRELGGLTLQRRRRPLSGGYTTFAAEHAGWRGAAVLLAGPLANLAIPAAVISFGSTTRVPDVMLAAISLSHFVVNVLPGQGHSGIATDGRRVGQLVRRRHLRAERATQSIRALQSGLAGDPTAALLLIERVIALPSVTPTQLTTALSMHATYLYVAERYAAALDACSRLQTHRQLTARENLFRCDALLCAHLTGQRLASEGQASDASDVVHRFLRDLQMSSAPAPLELAAVEHAAALACLATGDPQSALTYARASMDRTQKHAKAIRGMPISDSVTTMAAHRRLLKAAEALAAWQCDQRGLARQILVDLRFDAPNSVWVQTLRQALVEPGGL